jgi:cyclohexanecarboxylate-CoA ligase
MQYDHERLMARRTLMRARGDWRDETLLHHLARAVAGTPEKTALVAIRDEKEMRITYRELDHLADTVAGNLRARGVNRGDTVSFQLPNWWEFTVLHLACLKAGAVSNPLMVIFRERELGFMLALAESKVLVVPARFRGFDYPAMVARVRDRLPDLQHVFAAGGASPDAEPFDALLAPAPAVTTDLCPDDIIQLLYTSGTTGEPKGVLHTSNTLLSNLVPFAERLRLGSTDVIHMPSPLAHQLGFMYGLMMPVMLGATAVLQDVFSAPEMARQIAQEGATVTLGATPFLNDLAEYVERSGTPISSLRVFASAGAPIPRALVTKAKRTLGAAIVSAWGMSENGAVTTTRLDDPEEKATSTDGCALPGMELRVVDPNGDSVPDGELGQLKVRGCSNFVGYLKRPELDNTNKDGWFDTGDLARMEDGYIRIAGRSKDIIIRGGENIPVVEVENLLFRHPAIAEVAVVGYPDARLGERACAVVKLRQDGALSFKEMTDYLSSQSMARQYIPERLEVVEDMPRTPSGKVQKFRLRQMVGQSG